MSAPLVLTSSLKAPHSSRSLWQIDISHLGSSSKNNPYTRTSKTNKTTRMITKVKAITYPLPTSIKNILWRMRWRSNLIVVSKCSKIITYWSMRIRMCWVIWICLRCRRNLVWSLRMSWWIIAIKKEKLGNCHVKYWMLLHCKMTIIWIWSIGRLKIS